jgi:hypothetical protein
MRRWQWLIAVLVLIAGLKYSVHSLPRLLPPDCWVEYGTGTYLKCYNGPPYREVIDIRLGRDGPYLKLNQRKKIGIPSATHERKNEEIDKL